ncbi:DUF4145 domain-containing protein [Pedobacter sp. SG918]|uniref:DUF4145 domain-containing protein n=1 Tax=Pedobacter sp. SG918 TaxID=2587136 RepID=UPI0017FC6A35|nr:DUF4145 domain-containing protein [Pedobacter sp. SG918]NMN39410.1 hypothetical protein [Pedobacter sp. SG918]
MTTISFNGSSHSLFNLPNKCPFCHKMIIPKPISGYKRSNTVIDVFFNCPDIACNNSFLGYYSLAVHSYVWNGNTSIGNLNEREFTSIITNLSPNFNLIYNQAFQAEQYNLLEICGVGYRKALEFLIKDYAISLNPTKEDLIKSKLLAPCIKDYVADERIKKVAQRAVWLGNDETHYVRKWEGKDLQDLKSLIDLTIHWIEMEELTKSIINDMPE